MAENGLERGVKVFHRESLWHPIDDDADEADSFYDFTEEDYYRVTQSHSSKEETFLKTQAIRDREAEQVLSELGPVRIRYIFPEGLICQTEFSAQECIAHVYEFLNLLVLEELEGQGRLFTTPPKQFLDNHQTTLFHANLVPDANLFVQFQGTSQDGHASSALKSTILDLRDDVEAPRNEAKDDAMHEPTPQTKLPLDHPPPDREEKRVPKWFKAGRR